MRGRLRRPTRPSEASKTAAYRAVGWGTAVPGLLTVLSGMLG